MLLNGRRTILLSAWCNMQSDLLSIRPFPSMFTFVPTKTNTKKKNLARLKSGKRQNTKWLTKHFSERRRHDICFKPEAFLKIVKFNFNICGTWVFWLELIHKMLLLARVLLLYFLNTSLNSPNIFYANSLLKDYLSRDRIKALKLWRSLFYCGAPQ